MPITLRGPIFATTTATAPTTRTRTARRTFFNMSSRPTPAGRLEFDQAPFFRPGQSGHLKGGFPAARDGKPVAEVDAEPIGRIVEPGLDGEDHSCLQHCVVAEGQIRRLM